MKYLITIIVSLFTIHINAQNTITGTVLDSLQNPLVGATVILLEEADSTMAGFGITGGKGQYRVEDVVDGNYLLQVTYIGYRSHSQSIQVNDNESINSITLANADETLATAVVNGERIPMLIKQDTIVYNADAFGSSPSDVVEDLLKKLPGVEVARDGSIKAHGKQVQNVMVDGKEFFGSDPTIATKNLPADAIDKVEVFDKKSEAAEFTGIDDGNEEKTINLTLKEDKKNGYFGNAEGGLGTSKRFKSKANVNRFSPNLQLAAIGMANNVNQQGFSPNEYINFMGGIGAFMSNGGSFNLGGDGLPITRGLSDGFSETYAGGLNFNYDFGKKTQLRSSYFYSNLGHVIDKTTTTTHYLPDNNYDTEHITAQNNQTTGHRLNLKLEHKIDSTKRMTIKSNIGYNTGNTNDISTQKTFDVNGDLENIGDNSFNSNRSQLNLDNRLIYRQKFKKVGRSFVVNLNSKIGNTDETALLNALNQFYAKGGLLTSSTLTNQDQINTQNQNDYSAKVTYTEPLSKGQYLDFSFTNQNNNTDTNKDFFDLLNGTRTLNQTLSDLFARDYNYSRGGLKYKRNTKQSKLTLGLDYMNAQLTGLSQMSEVPSNSNFAKLLPSLRYDFDFPGTRNLNFAYSTALREPSLREMQPILNNADPLNIYIGNPNLDAAYEHDAGLSFMSFDQFSGINIFGRVQGTYTTNMISYSRSIDSLFRQVIKPINVDKDYRFFSYLNFGAPIKPIKAQLNLSIQTLYNQGYFMLNDEENQTNRWNTTYEWSIENKKKEMLDLAIGSSLIHSTTNYLSNETLNQNYLNQSYFIDLDLKLGKEKNWNFGSSFDYTVYSKEVFGNQAPVALWSAFVSRYVLDKRLEIKLAGFDLLNQNIGVNRVANFNYLEESATSSLGRFFMLSVGYKMKGFGKKDGVSVEFGR